MTPIIIKGSRFLRAMIRVDYPRYRRSIARFIAAMRTSVPFPVFGKIFGFIRVEAQARKLREEEEEAILSFR